MGMLNILPKPIQTLKQTFVKPETNFWIYPENVAGKQLKMNN